VALVRVGENRLEVIKVVRQLTNLGLKEAKDLVDGAPSVILHSVGEAEARAATIKLEDAGARVEVWEARFNVVLVEVGGKKIQVIKVVRQLTNLGLKEAKDLVDGAPSIILHDVGKAEADDAKDKIEDEGATVEIKEIE